MSEIDGTVYASIDRRVLATIVLHMHANNMYPRSMSEMIRTIVETFEEWLVRSGTERVESISEAVQILDEHFKASLNPGNRYGKKLLTKLQKEAETMEFGPIPQPRGRKPSWSSSDELKMREAAEKALKNPRIQELLNGGNK